MGEDRWQDSGLLRSDEADGAWAGRCVKGSVFDLPIDVNGNFVAAIDIG